MSRTLEIPVAIRDEELLDMVNLNQNLPPHVAASAAAPVARWVAHNHTALLAFGNDGVS